MPNRYQQIPLAAAMPGMTLSDAVLDTKGNVLLPKGTQLNDVMLTSLLRHQIATVVIAGGEVSAEVDNAERDQRIARVDHLFRLPASVTSDSSTSGEPASPPSLATGTLHGYIRNFRSGTLS